MTTLMRRRADGQIVPMTEEEIDDMQPTLDDRREQIVNLVEELRDQKLQRFAYDFGEPHGVLHLQLRGVDDRTNWLTLRTSAAELHNAGLGDTIMLGIRTEENITVSLNATMVKNVMSAMALYGGQVMSASWELKNAVRSSNNPEVDVDINAGWPAN